MPTITIARQFCGPPDSGNGGYVCGRLAASIDGPAVVRLHLPPPLDEALDLSQSADRMELRRGEDLVATARPAIVELDVPPAPRFEEAAAASLTYAGFRSHAFPTCFVCGPARAVGDGLRIFAGRLRPGGCVASPWVPGPSLADADGLVSPEFVWAALDCPGAFSFETPPGTPLLLGELAAALIGPIHAGERCVAIGWEIARDGRRHYTGTALFSETGERRGLARATWFEMPPRSNGSLT